MTNLDRNKEIKTNLDRNKEIKVLLNSLKLVFAARRQKRLPNTRSRLLLENYMEESSKQSSGFPPKHQRCYTHMWTL